MNETQRNRLRLYSLKLVEALTNARKFTSEITFSEFLTDEKTQYAVQRALDVASRNAFNILRQFSEIVGDSPWRELSSILRKVAPTYNESEPAILWRTVIEELPKYENEARRILHKAEILDLSSSQEKSPTLAHFTLKYKHSVQLSPVFLRYEITPYLMAVSELQRFINEINETTSEPVVIRRISQNSPVSVTLEGASEALKTLDEIIVPARRKHRTEMDKLEETTKQVEIETKKAEIARTRAATAKERAEVKKQQLEAERMRLENEKLRFELEKMKIETVIELIDSVAPNLSETERIGYIMKLLKPTETLLLSDLEISKE